MANPKANDKDKIEVVGGRELVIPHDGSAHYWKDTSEVCSPEERKMLLEFGAATLDFKGQAKQNPDIVFYVYEAQLKEGERAEMNPIRGMVLDVCRRPLFKGPDDEKATENDGRVMAWFLLTAPTYVKTLGGKLRKANMFEKVWVDLNQFSMQIVKIAAPKKENGRIVGICEAAIEPKLKEAFQATVGGKQETRQAWRGNIFGGWNGGAEFRKFNSADEIAKKLGAAATVTPGIMLTEADIVSVVGPAPSAAHAAPALPPG